MAGVKHAQGGKGAAGKRPAPATANHGAASKRPKVGNGYNKPHAEQQSKPVEMLTRKERKEATKALKAKRNRNFNLIQDVTVLWEALRRHDTSAKKRSELVKSILAKVQGRVPDLAGSHTASRVIQACVKYGTAEERSAILQELEPNLLPLSKSPYGRFVISKMVDLATKEQLAVILKKLKGHAAELLRHPSGSHVLDDLWTAADGAQRNSLAAEFYGREYVLFEGGTLNGAAGPPAHLADLLSTVDAAKQRSIVQHLAVAVNPVIEKGLVDCQLAHRLLAEYLAAAPASLVADAVESLSGNALLHMMHTHDGAAAACMVLAYGSAKDRKKAIKAFKGHVGAAARDEWGHLTLLTALSLVDDTALLRKGLLADIQAELADLVPHRAAHRVLLQLLRPYCPRYLPPDLLTLLKPPTKVHAARTAGAEAEAEEAEEGAGSPAGSDQAEGEEEDDEDGEGMSGRLAAGPLGVSKKDPDVRRTELLAGGLGAALVQACAEQAADWIRDRTAADVVVEVCCGGEGGVLEEVAGAAAIDGVHAAVVEAAALPRGAVAEGEDAGEGPAPGPSEHVLEHYFSSRALRRLVLASAEAGPAGAAATRFVDALWGRALKGRCTELVHTHAAKVLAAVVQSGSAAARKGAKAELSKALGKGVKVEAWCQQFLTSGNKRK